MPKVKTLQVNDRLIILDGQGPMKYVDLTKNKLHVYKQKKCWPFFHKYKVKTPGYLATEWMCEKCGQIRNEANL